jgi:hypothetical protein
MKLNDKNLFKSIDEKEYNNYEFSTLNENLSKVIHKVFVKYDLL